MQTLNKNMAQRIMMFSLAGVILMPGFSGLAVQASQKPGVPEIAQVSPQKCIPSQDTFTLNFEKKPLEEVLRLVSKLMCKNVVLNSSVDPKLELTLIGQTPIKAKDTWDVLLAALASKGLTMVEQGKAWTVIKRSDAKSHSTPLYTKTGVGPNNEQMITLFLRPKHQTPQALRDIAKEFISKDGKVSVVDEFLFVVDSGSNVRRIGYLFKEIDIEDAVSKIRIFELKHTEADKMASQLEKLFDVSSGSSRRRSRRKPSNSDDKMLNIQKIIADKSGSHNRLLVIADEDSLIKLKELIDKLDQPASDGGRQGKIYVVKLKHGDAAAIADTLREVAEQNRRRSRFSRRPDSETNTLFEGPIKITDHEDTNTLVIVATPNDYRALLKTINELDIRKEQVYIEAVILDISITDDSQFGINVFSGLQVGGNLGILANPGGRNIASGLSSTLTQGTSTTSGLGNYGAGALAVLSNFLSGGLAGVVGPKIPGTEIPSFGAVLQALSTSSNVDVLSTPYIITSNNTEAEMKVGEKVPVIRGASTVGGSSGLGIPLQNVSHEDVDLTLKITPHVGADNSVRLDIVQEVNELGNQEEILGQPQYRIRTKSAKTTIVVQDQQTAVIGGLINHKTSTQETSIPFLGKIPILGWLFKSKTRASERKTLVMVFTVYVLKTPEDYKKIYDRKMEERAEFAKMYYGGKIKDYKPWVDYKKKAGPLSDTIRKMQKEMNKPENGGPGSGNETVITPQGAVDAKNLGKDEVILSGRKPNPPIIFKTTELKTSEKVISPIPKKDFKAGQELFLKELEGAKSTTGSVGGRVGG